MYFKLLIIYLAFINLLSFMCYAVDKRNAIRQKARIPERRLILLALAGGSAGALAAMYLFRHKTRKLKFKLGVPLILTLQLLCAIFFTKITAGT